MQFLKITNYSFLMCETWPKAEVVKVPLSHDGMYYVANNSYVSLFLCTLLLFVQAHVPPNFMKLMVKVVERWTLGKIRFLTKIMAT
jgi:hypothetical protein